MATVTKPMALDETLQGTNNTISTQNSKLDTMNTKLQAIVDAIGSSSLIGDTDISGIADGTITGAIAGLDSGKVNKTSLGANNGVAQLDATGKVPSSQLPSFVDDVLEYASVSAFPATGESGKIYVALDTNLTYRWGGSAYVEISPSLALGETSSTAYRGDRGKIAYDHSQDANRVTTATAVGLYKVGATSEGHISGLTAIQKSDLTGLGLVGSVTDSTTNGNIVVDGVEIQAYDDTDVQNDIDAIEDELSTDYATVEGNPINFTTKSAQNAKSTILSLEPIQDLHGYDYPWVGGAGINKAEFIETPSTQTQNFSYSKNEADNIVCTKTTNNSSFFCSFKIHVTESGLYTFSATITGYVTCYGYKDSLSGEEVFGGGTLPRTETLPQGDIIIGFYAGSRVTQGTTLSVQQFRANKGSSDLGYAPYENLCPISGRTEVSLLGCGKNLLNIDRTPGTPDPTDISNLTNPRVMDTTHYFAGLAFDNYYKAANVRNININNDEISFEAFGGYGIAFPIEVKPQTYYSFRANITLGGAESACSFYDKDWNFISYSTNDVFVTPNNAKYLCAIIFKSGSTFTNITVNNIQLEEGQVVTNYESYHQSNDLTISFGQTVYGGQLDVENGALVVDKAKVTIDGSEADSNFSTFGLNDNTKRGLVIKNILLNGIAVVSDWTISPDLISSLYFTCPYRDIYYSATQNMLGQTDDNGNLMVYNPDRSTVSEWKTYFASNNIEICYKLATPITISLTPHTINLLKGVNNISTDGDSITLTYRDGSVATLGDLTSAVDSLDSKIDESKILTDTVTGDKYILVVSNGVLDIQQVTN